MAKSYTQLVKEIETLQVAADKARQKEVDGVVARIRAAITAYELTPEDLGFGSAAAPAAAGKKAAMPGAETGAKTGAKTGGKRKAKKGPKAAPVVKFKNDAGGTWGGLGKRPQWLRDALNEGKTLADFAVNK